MRNCPLVLCVAPAPALQPLCLRARTFHRGGRTPLCLLASPPGSTATGAEPRSGGGVGTEAARLLLFTAARFEVPLAFPPAYV